MGSQNCTKNNNDSEKLREFRVIRNQVDRWIRSSNVLTIAQDLVNLLIVRMTKMVLIVALKIVMTTIMIKIMVLIPIISILFTIGVLLLIKKMWSTVINLSNQSKQNPPRMIIYQNNKITSIKKISNITNKFFIEKVIDLRNKFTHLFIL